MKKFGHKYDGAQEQEQMLNMLNIGLGAFLLYLFHKNFGNKMSGGADGDVPDDKPKPWWKKPKTVSFYILTFVGFVLFFIALIFQDENNEVPDKIKIWPVLVLGQIGALIFIFLSLNPMHKIFGDSKDMLGDDPYTRVNFPVFLLLITVLGSIWLCINGNTVSGPLILLITFICAIVLFFNDDKLLKPQFDSDNNNPDRNVI